ncbi:hypothetical protein DACRYDRAFT_22398 [Dacryopinax primogenitus]|uniref:Uncharacterized protein n=1 Tax=Dacryopinax primogenitus (strain DJM 731) TaxID=1858805 RepID=M5FZQ8_DACPD|nr:uncharacterized protein DACRYDRAFT_22398 [Dacryopinax primogenitus]EJU01994.1 hypothetical protein DACRYDRAFT_22398 [Dacryopinax primogenitus]
MAILSAFDAPSTSASTTTTAKRSPERPAAAPPALPVDFRPQLIFLTGQQDRTTASVGAGIAHQRARLAHSINGVYSPTYTLPDEIIATIFELSCADYIGEPPNPFAIALSHVSARFRHVVCTTPLLWHKLVIHLPMTRPEQWLQGGKWRTIADRTGSCLLDISVRIHDTMAQAQDKGLHIPPPEAYTFVAALFVRCRKCTVMGHHAGTSLLPARTSEFKFPDTKTLTELRMFDTVTKVSSMLALLSSCKALEYVQLCDLRVQSEPEPPQPSPGDPSPPVSSSTPISPSTSTPAPPPPDNLPPSLTLPCLTTLHISVQDTSGFHAHGLFTHLLLPALTNLHLRSGQNSFLIATHPSSPQSFARVRTLSLSAARATLASILRFTCCMPQLVHLSLSSMVLHASTPASLDHELMTSLLPSVPPLRKLSLHLVLPCEPLLHFLVGACAPPAAAAPVSYNAARRRRARTLEKLELEECWLASGVRTWVKERLGEEAVYVRKRKVQEWVPGAGS